MNWYIVPTEPMRMTALVCQKRVIVLLLLGIHPKVRLHLRGQLYTWGLLSGKLVIQPLPPMMTRSEFATDVYISHWKMLEAL